MGLGWLIGMLLIIPFAQNNTAVSIITCLVCLIAFLSIVFLSVMNMSRRMADLAWANDNKKLILFSVGVHCLPIVPFVGSIASLIICLILLFQPSRID